MNHIPEKFPAHNTGKPLHRMRRNFGLADFYPGWQNGAVRKSLPTSPWDFDEIVARANARARDLSKNRRGAVRQFEVLGAEDLLNLRRPPKKNGIGLLRLERMAKLLKWTLPQLLGVEGVRALDRDKFKVAARLVEDVCGANMPKPGDDLAEFLTEWIDLAYEIVHSVSLERPDSWESEDSFRAMAESLRVLFSRNDANAKPTS